MRNFNSVSRETYGAIGGGKNGETRGQRNKAGSKEIYYSAGICIVLQKKYLLRKYFTQKIDTTEEKIEGYLNLISVPAIATIVYWVINIIKHAVGENEKFKRFIPLIATGFGVICGVICYFALPEIIPADRADLRRSARIR